MRYQGGKHRIVKYILPYLQHALASAPGLDYVEPFVGGANVIMYVKHARRFGFDLNHYMIALYNAIKAGWIPPTDVSEEMFNAIKHNKEAYPPELVGFVGTSCSYGSIWFRSYARFTRVWDNYAANDSRRLVQQKPLLDPIVFSSCSYDQIILTRPAVLYCDPPYRATERYTAVAKFDSDRFFDWCRARRHEGHRVFVSEYSAPTDFREVWAIKKRVTASIRTTGGGHWNIEKLYTLS